MTNKKCFNFLAFSLSIILCLMFAGVGSANAQQTLPAGGSSFSTAVKIVPGQYQGFALENQEMTYYFEAKPGQLAQFKGKFVSKGEYGTMDGIALYNENEEGLVDASEAVYRDGKEIKADWFLNSDKTSHKIYVKIWDDGETESFTLDFSLLDKFDANSGTDAGDTFDKFVNITPGTYNGYLSGISGVTQSLGNDWKDVYKIGLKKGITYEFKITPPSKTSLTLSLYDLDRQLLKEETSTNNGAIVSLSLVPSADTDIFMFVSNYEYPYQDALANYKLEIKSSVPLIKFYACDGQFCDTVGEFDSSNTCQKTTTKTCYQAADCNDKCAITPPPAQCTKDADCSTGKICKNNKCEAVVIPPSECTKNSDCPTGGICENKKCVGSPILPQCTKDTDCSTGQVCKDSQCQSSIPVVSCAKDTDCPTNYICTDGKCIGASLPPGTGTGTVTPLIKSKKNINWFLIGGAGGVVAIIILLVIVLSMGKKKKPKEEKKQEYFSGSVAADKPTVGYKHPCKYCQKLIPPNSGVCPFCGKLNPLGPSRCPKCHEPTQKDWQTCNHCGLNLRIVCPFCGKTTFFGDYCEDCGKRLVVVCPHCGQEQPPISNDCIKCNRPLEKK